MVPSEHREHLAVSLESTLPIRTLATLTFPGDVEAHDISRDARFSEFIQGVQATTHQTIGWVRADEATTLQTSKGTTRPHLHAALIAAAPISEETVVSTWQAVTGSNATTSCVAQSFIQGMGGISYLLKEGSYSFSPNIHLFNPATDPASLSRGERRTYRRIHDI